MDIESKEHEPVYSTLSKNSVESQANCHKVPPQNRAVLVLAEMSAPVFTWMWKDACNLDFWFSYTSSIHWLTDPAVGSQPLASGPGHHIRFRRAKWSESGHNSGGASRISSPCPLL